MSCTDSTSNDLYVTHTVVHTGIYCTYDGTLQNSIMKKFMTVSTERNFSSKFTKTQNYVSFILEKVRARRVLSDHSENAEQPSIQEPRPFSNGVLLYAERFGNTTQSESGSLFVGAGALSRKVVSSVPCKHNVYYFLLDVQVVNISQSYTMTGKWS